MISHGAFQQISTFCTDTWSTTFSSTEKDRFDAQNACTARRMPHPKIADCNEPIVTHPLCKPKYILLKHNSDPTRSPTPTALGVCTEQQASYN